MDSTTAKAALVAALSMPRAEIMSRKRALNELFDAATAVLPFIDATDTGRVTGDEVASIAARLMKHDDPEVRSMAASLVSQSDGPDPRQAALPLDPQAVSRRALRDAETSGQAQPVPAEQVIGSVINAPLIPSPVVDEERLRPTDAPLTEDDQTANAADPAAASNTKE